MAARKGLVLSRFVGERIIIGGNIVVEVAEMLFEGRPIRGKVRLAIQAPPEVTINREEIESASKGKEATA